MLDKWWEVQVQSSDDDWYAASEKCCGSLPRHRIVSTDMFAGNLCLLADYFASVLAYPQNSFRRTF